MATGNAISSSKRSDAIKEDLKKQNPVGIPMYVGTQLCTYVTRSSVKDGLTDNLGIVKITDAFDPIAQKAIIGCNNHKPCRVQKRQQDGTYESGYADITKVMALKADGWTQSSRKKTGLYTRETKLSIIYYDTVNGLKLGARITFRTLEAKSEVETILTQLKMEKATAKDMPELIFGQSFPTLGTAIAKDGTAYPVGPKGYNDVPDDFLSLVLGTSTKQQFFCEL